MIEIVKIDGTMGEGGGQVLRSALALAAVTGRPFLLERIRGGREKPGLRRQHLACVLAAREVCGAAAEGAELGSSRLEFRPGAVRPGEYRFSVGSAGSACLVLQTVLLPLALSPAPSHLILEGGTHNPLAPFFDHLDRVFLPLVRRLGINVHVSLERAGFFPAGGGRFQVTIDPPGPALAIDLLDGGAEVRRSARALVANLPEHIGWREVGVVRDRLQLDQDDCEVRQCHESPGPGNVVMVEIQRERVTEMFIAHGRRGVPAERVAGEVVRSARDYIRGGAPVGRLLADQLLLPLALRAGGRFRTVELSPHSVTNSAVIRMFLDARFEALEEGGGVTVAVSPASG